jgi:hypothetical protein
LYVVQSFSIKWTTYNSLIVNMVPSHMSYFGGKRVVQAPSGLLRMSGHDNQTKHLQPQAGVYFNFERPHGWVMADHDVCDIVIYGKVSVELF